MTIATAAPDTSRYQTIADGVEIRFARRHPDGGMSFYIRMKKGAHAPRHAHPGGEETCVLGGTLRIEARVDKEGAALPALVVAAGEYAWAPAGETHEGEAVEDTVFFVVAPGGVVPTRA